MVSVNCLIDRIWNHLGDKPLGDKLLGILQLLWITLTKTNSGTIPYAKDLDCKKRTLAKHKHSLLSVS